MDRRRPVPDGAAMTGPTALELTALALAPWKRTQSPEAAIALRTVHNAREGFDACDKWSSDWLSDVSDAEMRELALRAIVADVTRERDDVDAHVEILRKRYVAECGHLYREQSIRELAEGYDNAD
jgi:hypothetical protein